MAEAEIVAEDGGGPRRGANLERLAELRREWLEGPLQRSLKRGERKPEFETPSHLPVKTVYTPEDVADLDYERDLGMPGMYPFTRGIQPNMYRGRAWSIRQYAGFGTAEESNQRFKFLLDHGQPGLSVAFDLPTQMGLDSDDPRADGEVGQVGVAIDSLADMETLFDGIPLAEVSTSMTINAPAPVLAAMYIVVAEKQGARPEQVSATTQNDVLKEYVARGTFIYPPGPSLRLAADLIAHCARHSPRFNAISLSGYHMREAGSTAVQEIAFSFANAQAYLDATIARGIDVDAFAPRLSWIFNTHIDFFEEIAKYRALRRMWARIMRERYGAKDPGSWMLRTHTQTGGSLLTAQQPENNIVRAAIQALSAVLGGVQSMALSCYDEALAIPTEKAQQIAVRTQQIIAEEIGVTDTVDPLAGSYYVEHLTNELELMAWAELERIEKEVGGAVAAIESGYYQRAIQEESYRFEREVESGARVVVGVNRYRTEEETPTEFFRVDNSALARAQVAKLEALRVGRDGRAVEAALAGLRAAAAEESADLMPPILDAVRAYATLGEICGVMRDVFGEYRALAIV
ncbi:MAG TPA: methylmalonyl-CoA mutase family protein [Candidatus Dormibacteraeota bacterium]|jgi:methylmalonyl-CoA mutase N-terminal domain/subunit|nr:methylmalonyl-CoA mutase family protein [Candidatus Dormibacteraeota bacterium]